MKKKYLIVAADYYKDIAEGLLSNALKIIPKKNLDNNIRNIQINPSTPRSDSHVTSPYNFHPLSSKQVMRILKFIR